MSDTESSSTSILRPINNRDNYTDNDSEIEERPNICQFPSIDLNIECNSKRGRRKQANMALVTRKYTRPTNPALQSINLEHQISTIDEQQHDNQMKPISQHQENNVNNRLLIQPTSSITIARLNSKEAPKKRDRPSKINKNANI